MDTYFFFSLSRWLCLTCYRKFHRVSVREASQDTDRDKIATEPLTPKRNETEINEQKHKTM